MYLVSRLSAFYRGVIIAMASIAGILLLFLTLTISGAVASRYLLNHPISWVVEASEYILVYITFLAAAWILRRNEHVRMDFVLARLKPVTQSLVNAVTSAISTVVCLGLAYFATKVTLDLYLSHYLTPTLFRIPKFIFIAAIALGSILLFIEAIVRTSHYVREWRAGHDKGI